jgi:hypothetical protein
MGLEGIVSKRKDSAYPSGRSPDWLKMKKTGVRGGAAGGGEGLGSMRDNPGAQYEISVDGVPRTQRDRTGEAAKPLPEELGSRRSRVERSDIALQTARFLKSQKPNSVVKMKDLRTGEETIVAFKAGE